MADIELRPNASSDPQAAWTIVGGAGSEHAATNDNSDATYVVNTSGGATKILILDFDNFTVPTLSQIRSVAQKWRRIRDSIDGTFESKLRLNGLDGTVYTIDNGAVIATSTNWLENPPDGGAWTQAKLDAIQMVLRGSNSFVRIHEAFLVAKTNEAPNSTRTYAVLNTTNASVNITLPATTLVGAGFRADDVGKRITGTGIQAGSTIATVTNNTTATLSLTATATGATAAVVGTIDWISAPAEGGSVTTTTKPTITWTYSDPEGDAQERYRIKIFTAAQYGIGGFDPETSPNTWDSGEVLSAAVTKDVPVDLANATYRVYVKVADVGSSGRYSAWDFNGFTVNVTPPPAPTLVVTAQPTNADGPRTKLDLTRVAGPPATTYMVLEYSDNAGASWSIYPGGDHITNSPDGTTFTIYDYRPKSAVQRSYRAKSILVT